MRINTKCSMALHILILLAVFKEHKLTSELIAKSIGCNPVVVRSLLGKLKQAGIANVKRGSGGAELAVLPETITIWDVYQIVEHPTLNDLVGLHPNPSKICPVGKNIYTLLEAPYKNIEEAVKEKMSSYTLKQLIDNYDAQLH